MLLLCGHALTVRLTTTAALLSGIPIQYIFSLEHHAESGELDHCA